jgi:osomolarity two-component system sensor histidine kinase NIK1
VVNQKVALKFLESAGHRVSVVENGALAVEAIKKHDYDVVLMDISMPFMGGIEATSITRKYEDSNNLERVPIIALTAHAMTGDREKWSVCLALAIRTKQLTQNRSISIGMDEYLTKPLRKGDLLSMLDKVVNARRIAAMPSARGIGSYTTTHAPL